MKELLIVGKQPFELKLVESGVEIAQRYKDLEGQKRTRFILLTPFGLGDHCSGPAYLLRKLGWNIEHPIKFNQLFRQWLKNSCSYGANIVKVYEEELAWRKKNREWERGFQKGEEV